MHSVERTRLTQPVYDDLERQALPPYKVPADPHQAAFLAGVEHVLRIIRKGIVV